VTANWRSIQLVVVQRIDGEVCMVDVAMSPGHHLMIQQPADNDTRRQNANSIIHNTSHTQQRQQKQKQISKF
jgi:hypothetical protein